MRRTRHTFEEYKLQKYEMENRGKEAGDASLFIVSLWREIAALY